jgi:hypothetical protein
MSERDLSTELNRKWGAAEELSRPGPSYAEINAATKALIANRKKPLRDRALAALEAAKKAR